MIAFVWFFLFTWSCSQTNKNADVDITALQQKVQEKNWTWSLQGPPYNSEDIKNLLEIVDIADQLPLTPAQRIFGTITPQNAHMYDLIFGSKTISKGRFFVGEGNLRHEIVIDHDIYVMKREISQELYQKLMGRNPSAIKNAKNAVTRITWSEAIKLANVLSERMGLEPCYQINDETIRWVGGYHCEGWRLPTETEWDYVALHISEHHKDKEIFDMQGGVSEWTWDWFWLEGDDDFSTPFAEPIQHNPNHIAAQHTSKTCQQRCCQMDESYKILAEERFDQVGVRFFRSAVQRKKQNPKR